MGPKRDRARELRHQGISVREIAKILGAAKSSVSVWVRDIELTPHQLEQLKAQQHRYGAQNKGSKANRDNHRKLRESFQQEGREKAREKRWLHSVGCMLYWAEGAKHKNKVYFVNSDPNMMTLFIRFLREEMAVANEAMRVYIHCHTTDLQEIKQIEEYWLNLLHLPSTCLRTTQIKRGSTSRYNILQNGICGLLVSSTRLAQHIYGAIQEYGGFEKPEWLF
jgi:predicted transcriptional regulator